MKVRPIKDYIETRGTNIPIKAIDKTKQYEVILVEKTIFKKTYYIVDDMFKRFPMPWPARLFEVIEPAGSGWVQNMKISGFSGRVTCKEGLYKLLNQDKGFYERLVDGDPTALGSFNKIFPGLIDSEK